MKRVVLVMSVVLAIGCKKNREVTATGSGSPAVVSDAGSAPAPAPVLEFEALGKDDDEVLKAAFGDKMPKLPALSRDGATIATIGGLSSMPMTPQPWEVIIAKFPSGEIVRKLPVLDLDAAMAAEHAGDNWLTPALQKMLQEHAAAIVKQLEGFRTLQQIGLDINSNGERQPTKIGDLTLAAVNGDDNTLTVTLHDRASKLLQRAHVESHSQGNRGEAFENTACTYRPTLNTAYSDPAQPNALYIEVGYFFQEDCEAGHPTYFAWSTDPAAASPEAAVFELVGNQFEIIKDDDKLRQQILLPDALAIDRNSVVAMKDVTMPALPGHYDGHDDKDTMIQLSRDGASAWASTLTTLRVGDLKHGNMPQDKRASDVLVKTSNGWRIAAFAWTDPTLNTAANRDAKAGKLVAGKLAGDPGDAGLRDAFAKLTTEGAKNVASDLVAIGSGPGERTVGGPEFAKAWNAAWKGKTTIVSSIARVLPSGTTGWVGATIELAKSGYKIPFTVLAVFDKGADGTWTLVHIHFVV